MGVSRGRGIDTLQNIRLRTLRGRGCAKSEVWAGRAKMHGSTSWSGARRTLRPMAGLLPWRCPRSVELEGDAASLALVGEPCTLGAGGLATRALVVRTWFCLPRQPSVRGVAAGPNRRCVLLPSKTLVGAWFACASSRRCVVCPPKTPVGARFITHRQGFRQAKARTDDGACRKITHRRDGRPRTNGECQRVGGCRAQTALHEPPVAKADPPSANASRAARGHNMGAALSFGINQNLGLPRLSATACRGRVLRLSSSRQERWSTTPDRWAGSSAWRPRA